jgi:hypothetical protein
MSSHQWRVRAAHVQEFQKGYATFSDGLDGKLRRDPDFPTEYHDAVTGTAKPVEDTAALLAIGDAAGCDASRNSHSRPRGRHLAASPFASLFQRSDMDLKTGDIEG